MSGLPVQHQVARDADRAVSPRLYAIVNSHSRHDARRSRSVRDRSRTWIRGFVAVPSYYFSSSFLTESCRSAIVRLAAACSIGRPGPKSAVAGVIAVTAHADRLWMQRESSAARSRGHGLLTRCAAERLQNAAGVRRDLVFLWTAADI